MPLKKTDKLTRGLENRLRFFQEIGVDDLFPVPRRAPRSEPGTPSPALDRLRDEILCCCKCGLAAGRTQAVPGEGNPRAELLFVGEGPGRDEDAQGRPFVGRAGQLLTRIIAAMTYDRSEVFIANIVKCRPPENRMPVREEVDSCTPFLIRQIEIIKPRVIVTLGKTSADFFVPGAVGSMTSIRGRFYEWKGLPVMPTFHPSYLIRNEGNRKIKQMVWDDMQMVMALLGRK